MIKFIFDMCEKLDKEDKSSDFMITHVASRLSKLDVFSKGGNCATRIIIEESTEEASDHCEKCGNLIPEDADCQCK